MSTKPIEDAWFILDVMRKTESCPGHRIWVALLIDTDPEIYCAGLDQHRQTQSRFVDLGGHQTRDDAWVHAEQLMATRH